MIQVKTLIALAATVLLLAGCSNDAPSNDAPTDDVMTPVEAPEGYPGDMLAEDVRLSIQDLMDRELAYLPSRPQVDTITCEDVPVVEKGAIADCEVTTTIADVPELATFTARVTFQDDLGHFEWERY